MTISCLFISILFVCTVEIKSRKYDIDSEAVKLYGENLETVIQRFRKTPDYMKILSEKMAVSTKMMDVIRQQAVFTYLNKLNQKVKQIILEEQSKEQSFRSFGFLRRGIFDGEMIRRQNQEEETTLSPVEMLDEYAASNPLPVSEINYIKDLAFQYAGDAIHAIIKGMGPDDSQYKSTRMPDSRPAGPSTTATEHPQVHEVTTAAVTQPPPTPPVSEEIPVDVRQRPNKHRRPPPKLQQRIKLPK